MAIEGNIVLDDEALPAARVGLLLASTDPKEQKQEILDAGWAIVSYGERELHFQGGSKGAVRFLTDELRKGDDYFEGRWDIRERVEKTAVPSLA